MNWKDAFKEEFDPDLSQHIDLDKVRKLILARQEAKRKVDITNNIVPIADADEEQMALREQFQNDFVAMHEYLFPDSTGQKPFGEQQKKSIYFGQDIFNKGGRLIKLEPRGFAKTTRIANEALFAVLSGMLKYVVILASNITKANLILNSIRTEVQNNNRLFDMFPKTMACFRHLGRSPIAARAQCYDGQPTYIIFRDSTIQFPHVDEPSAGSIIEVRPLINVKGLFKKIEAGPDVGKVFRPNLYIFDDPQTHQQAKSEPQVQSIIDHIKRDALRGGSHSKRASAIMAITPVAPGDVAWWFEKNEVSWDLIRYKMIEKFPDNHEWWMDDYARTYLNYDREVRGDRIRAALEAKQLVLDNWDMAHKGAVVTWEHAYGWDEEPQLEVSAVQHAYNIILDDGWQDFEFECQCNTEYGEYDEGDQLNAPHKQILSKTLPYRRNTLPQKTSKIVCHIDVNKDILSYVIGCSPQILQPHFIDYGTHPKQVGTWSKQKLHRTLGKMYPHVSDYREVLYLAVKDLITMLATRTFTREDGMELPIDLIGIDVHYEDYYITKAIRESEYRNIVIPCWGEYVGPEDTLLHNKPATKFTGVWDNLVRKPNQKNTIDYLHVDANFFKTELHRGFNLETGLTGSCTIFGREVDGEEIDENRHTLFANHINSEYATRETGTISKRTRVIWKVKRNRMDNEYLDNAANVIALFSVAGVRTGEKAPSLKRKKDKEESMRDFISNQEERLDL